MPDVLTAGTPFELRMETVGGKAHRAIGVVQDLAERIVDMAEEATTPETVQREVGLGRGAPRTSRRSEQQHVAARRVGTDAIHRRVDVARPGLLASDLAADRAAQIHRAPEAALERAGQTPHACDAEIVGG